MPCRGFWSPKCYQLEDVSDHHIKVIEQEDHFFIAHDEKIRFMYAREGGNFVIIIQCEQCNVQSIKGKDTWRGILDEKLFQ